MVRLPRISNHDDMQPLAHEEHVRLHYAEHPHALQGADLIILPGSKCTMEDLVWLRERGLAEALTAHARAGGALLGICGGCEMLGSALHDPHGHESTHTHMPGLDLLPLTTHFGAHKLCAQVQARVAAPSLLTRGLPENFEVHGYEIHQGRISAHAEHAAFTVRSRNARPCKAPEKDGAVSQHETVMGTMLHGLFDSTVLRHNLLRNLWQRRGASMPASRPIPGRLESYDRLANAVAEHCDMPLLWRLAGRQFVGNPANIA